MSNRTLPAPKPAHDWANTALGKLLPYDADLEAAVLGTVISEGRLAADMLAVLHKPACFYREANQHVFTALATLFSEGKTIDALSVGVVLERQGGSEVGANRLYAMELCGQANLYSSLKEKCFYLLELAMKRYWIIFSGKLQQQCYDPAADALAITASVEEAGRGMLEQIGQMADTSPDRVLQRTLENLSLRVDKPGTLAGLTTGIGILNQQSGGLQKGNLIILAARPGMGKSAVALHMIRANAIEERIPVGLISREMTAEEVELRLIAAETGFSNFELQAGRVNMKIIHERVGRLDNKPLYVHDKPITLPELRLRAMDWKRRKGIQLLVVDYLQLLDAGRVKDLTEAVTKIARFLKDLADEVEIPVLALSQLSRECENRNAFEKRPQLSDLRQSGEIEQAANLIWSLFRPHYYSLQYEDGSADEKTLEIAQLKSRNGPPTPREAPLLARYDQTCNRVFDTTEYRIENTNSGKGDLTPRLNDNPNF